MRELKGWNQKNNRPKRVKIKNLRISQDYYYYYLKKKKKSFLLGRMYFFLLSF